MWDDIPRHSIMIEVNVNEAPELGRDDYIRGEKDGRHLLKALWG
jgi:hypothetical protein